MCVCVCRMHRRKHAHLHQSPPHVYSGQTETGTTSNRDFTFARMHIDGDGEIMKRTIMLFWEDANNVFESQILCFENPVPCLGIVKLIPIERLTHVCSTKLSPPPPPPTCKQFRKQSNHFDHINIVYSRYKIVQYNYVSVFRVQNIHSTVGFEHRLWIRTWIPKQISCVNWTTCTLDSSTNFSKSSDRMPGKGKTNINAMEHSSAAKNTLRMEVIATESSNRMRKKKICK